MKTPALLLLAALMAVSTAAPAKGIKIRSGGSHHSTSHSEPSTSIHLPRTHTNSPSEAAPSEASQQAAAQAASVQAEAKAKRAAAMNERLNAELAAQRAATPAAAPVGTLMAKAPAAEPVTLAANEKRLTQPVAVGKVAAITPAAGADITTLVPRDSSQRHNNDLRRDDRYNGRGVNCSLYPSRC
ncbi:hypothetical protein FVQ98_08060 [Ottowia sp. GY511]|uniref:DUF4148 domain-containing protein n=1 Tax=Ottowia flava TaxID=2675430 RepID=A0ABW4KVS8_9BURK|nr:hypothetical protein [Ottowia sp. GY511]TXK29823.1 hypothetical protein FVQ98_08060 [Ottowia sp. GY511]